MDKVIVVASTHWDREWYRTFNDFRIRLCDLMNNLLNLLEKDDDFICYTFDGQSVVLEDYLEIFPKNKERIKKLVAKGKLTFGPLYNLPDEFLSSGEALIRNFLIGHKVCCDIGGKMNAGYIPDNFGHVSQMPQILNGVQIKSAFLFRGSNIDTIENKEFIWKSPDGSKVLGEYMMLGYWSLKSWGKLGLSVEEHFKNALETLKSKSKLNTFLLINGSDHLYQDPEFTEMLRNVKSSFKGLDIKNGSIEDYFNIAFEKAKNQELKEVVGELRDFRYGPDPTSVTSTRYYLKFAMFKLLCEIERYTEPLNTITYKMGQIYPDELLTYAWKNILKFLAHDAISGCSTDEVIDDIYSYIKHASTIADRLSKIAIENIACNISTEKLKGNEQYLCLFNPLQFNNTIVTEAIIHIENFRDISDFELFDEYGDPVLYEYIDQWEDVITREFKYVSKQKIHRKCFKIRFEAKDIPALGFKKYIVKPLSAIEKRRSELFIRLQSSDRFIENEFYKIIPDQNGSLTILDKQNNRRFYDINTYISRGDIGDEYQHVSPLNDEHVFQVLKGISIIKNSPLSSALKVKSVLNVPKAADDVFLGRHAEYVECPIVTVVTLYKGCQRIDFKVEIENNAINHMITVKFPVNFKNAVDCSYTAFDEVKRDNYIFDYDEKLKSTQSILKPMRRYVAVKGDDGSLYVMAKGLHEYHTKVSKQGMDLYITLIRSTTHMFRGLPISWQNGQNSTTPIIETQGSRELGKQTFYYSLYFGSDKINELSQQYIYPPRSFDIRKRKREASDKINHKYFIKLDNNDVLLSAVKKHEYSEGIVLRVYNTKDKPSKVDIKFGFDISRCYSCDLIENIEEEIAVQNNTVSISLKSKKIKTIIVY